MKLKLARSPELSPFTEDELRRGLAGLGDTNEFAILSRSESDFIQAGVDGSGFVVNRSAGAERVLYWASPKSGSLSSERYRFTRQATEALFVAYFRGDPMTEWNWQPEQLPERTLASRFGVFLLRYGLWPILIGMLILSYYLKYFR